MSEKHAQGQKPVALPGGAFVGRQPEMSELKAALDDALAGHGRLVMLVGEPGIGKTRTAQELAALAEQRGAKVLWGWCYEGDGAPPYWPWLQPMRAYVQQADAEQLSAEMGPGATDIAEIVPDLRDKLPDLKLPPSLEPEEARFRLFDSIATFLKNATQRQPLVLVLDDLHWADRASLLLLEFLVREIGASRLLLVGAYRDVEGSRRQPMSQTLGALVREQLFHRVQLNGLTQQEVGELVQGSAGITLTIEVAEVMHKRTDGNPFFVGEITRQVNLDNITEDQEWASIVPEGVRDAIGRRLIRLSDQCNQMLTTASIIGRGFEFRLLNSLMGDDTGDQLLVALDEAMGAHMIEELPQSVGLYQFTHDLIRETLMEQLSTIRRVQLHARIAQALEALYGDDAEAHAGELAHHFAEARTVLGAEKLVLYSLVAGEQALSSHAHEDALGHYQRGLEAKQGREIDGDMAALLFGLGRAQSATLPRHRLTEVEDTLRPAFDYYVRVGDIPHALAITEYIGLHIKGASAVGILAEALHLVPAGSHQSGRILSRYAAVLDSSLGEHNTANDALDQALEIAQRENDNLLEFQVLVRMASLHYYQLDYQQSLERCLRAIDLIPRISRPSNVDVYWFAVRDLIGLGRIEEAWPFAARQLELAEESRSRFGLAQALHANGVLAYLEGNWEDAREFSDRGLEIDHRDVRLLNWRSDLENEVGNFADGDIYLDRILETVRLAPSDVPQLDHEVVPLTIGVAARITGAFNRFEAASSAAELVLSSTSGLQPHTAQLSRTGLALLAVQMGDVSVAKEQYSFLKSWPISRTPLNLMCGYRVLGLLAQTIGNLDGAIDHFEDALAFCRKAGYRPELAWSCCDYSDTLNQRDGEGDQAKAIRLLNESLAISTELGMRPLMGRVIERLARIQALPSSSPAYPAGLSEREVEVLRLLASGKSNAVIAAELVLSVRTVERHISNIYGKTNSHGRAEATAFAFTHGLMSSE